MQRSSTQQTFIEAPVERVWELVGDPNRHPEWWPEMLEIECADLKEGCRYRGVVKGPFGAAAHDLVVDRFEDCSEVSIFCDGTGVTTRFVLDRGSGWHVRGGLLHDRAEQHRHEGARRRYRTALHALMAGELAGEPEERSSASAGGGHSALHRQSGGPPSLKPANDVGSIQAEAPQRRRGQARLVALVA